MKVTHSQNCCSILWARKLAGHLEQGVGNSQVPAMALKCPPNWGAVDVLGAWAVPLSFLSCKDFYPGCGRK